MKITYEKQVDNFGGEALCLFVDGRFWTYLSSNHFVWSMRQVLEELFPAFGYSLYWSQTGFENYEELSTQIQQLIDNENNDDALAGIARLWKQQPVRPRLYQRTAEWRIDAGRMEGWDGASAEEYSVLGEYGTKEELIAALDSYFLPPKRLFCFESFPYDKEWKIVPVEDEERVIQEILDSGGEMETRF